VALGSDWLGRRARLSPDALAVVDAATGEELSFAAWDPRVCRTARLLAALGVSRGDRVAVLARNGLAFLELWLACGKLGAVLQPLHWRLTAAELQPLLADGDPSVLAFGPEFAPVAGALRSDARRLALADPADPRPPAPDHPSVPAVADRPAPCDPDPLAHRPPVALTLAERDALSGDPLPELELGDDAPWVLCATGGTTGVPKAAVLTHGSIAWNALGTAAGWGLRPDDLAILDAPLFHTGGLNVLTAPLLAIGGASVVCREFAPDRVFDLLERRPVTLYFGVPTMFLALQAHPRWPTARLDRLRLVVSGGAPCPEPVFRRFRERGVPHFKTGYGLTEAGPNNFWLPDADAPHRPGVVGFPLPHVRARVVADDGATCPPGQVGELQLAGPHLCAGYWRRPEATAAAFVDGWLRTGDLARREPDGAVVIVGRAKEMLISGGENVYPAEVEGAMMAHPLVADAALIGVPDATWGEVGRAVVVARGELAPADLLAFLRARLAAYKLPASVVLVDALPRTAAGKLDRRALVARHGDP
jgi:fatty-acyl-CoA synthase